MGAEDELLLPTSDNDAGDMRTVIACLLGGSSLLVDQLIEKDPVGDGPADDGAVSVHSFEQVDVEAKFGSDVAEGDSDQGRQHHSSCNTCPPADPQNRKVDTPVQELDAVDHQCYLAILFA